MSNSEKSIDDLSPEAKRALLTQLLELSRGSESIDDLPPEAKRALLAQLLEGGRNEPEYFPLSFSQERLWFIDQFMPGVATYNIPAVCRMIFPLNKRALERSLNEIVNRHSVLRTTFAVVDDHPVQVVSPTFKLPLELIDLSHLPDLDRQQRLQQLADREARTPFDLSRGPLLRVTLVKLAESDHVLLLTVHHIVSDAWSMGVLFDELGKLNQAFSQDRQSPLPPLPIQYADYALWQREWLQGEVLEQQLSYWRSQLKDAPAVIELPADRARPAVQSFAGATQGFVVPKATTDQIKHISQREGVTVFMSLLAAFKVLLKRYTGLADIVVGTPIANRTQAEVEGLIGFFTNTLVLRSVIRDHATYRDVLRTVREVTLDAYGHQDLPFEKLVEELEPERDLSHNPLFQVMFSMQNTPTMTIVAPGTVWPDSDSHVAPQVTTGTSKFDLVLSVTEAPEELYGVFEYSTDLFDASRIRRMGSHYRRLLEQIGADPDRRVSEFELLTEAERIEVIEQWNDTAMDYPGELCVHQVFEAQTEQAPDAVALIFEDQALTYRELNGRANKVAHYLRKLGVGPERCAGICLDRSLDMMVGLLGILKAGGAYVPLDPAYPPERLAAILEDARVSALVTQQELAHRLSESQTRVVCLDLDASKIAEESEENPASGISSENLVYVIYTSGSTGRPKGVAMTHRSLVNLLTWQIPRSNLPLGARTLQFISLSFDVSFQEIFSTLCAGGTLVLIDEEDRRDVGQLLRCLKYEHVSRMFCSPVVLQQMAEAFGNQRIFPPSLRQLMVSGEQLQITQHTSSLFATFQHCILNNHYGPTETHLATEFRLQGHPGGWVGRPPIGRPIANTRAYLLDRHLQPVPVGVAGQLLLSGDGVARGYLDYPDMTAERFIPDPFSNRPGARLYKTADLARYLEGGDIEYLGRIDLQVKIRGFRIELGEVETALIQYPAVSEAVVIDREDSPGERRLVAYLVGNQEGDLSTSAIRSFLARMLPDYMIPSSFVIMDTLPLTPNGKLDRRALPAPDTARPDLTEAYIAPRSEIEKTVAEIWARILKIEQPGVEDNFFELGGHSLLATQIVSRMRDAFHVEISLRQFFESPTVAGLASAIVGKQSDSRQTGGEYGHNSTIIERRA